MKVDSRRIIIGLIAAFLILGAIAAALALYFGFKYEDRPQIAQGLDASFAAAERQFTQRLNERFPPGFEEEEMSALLADQGFNLREPTHDGTHVATHTASQFPCNAVSNVVWRSEGGRIQWIRGVYGAQCP